MFPFILSILLVVGAVACLLFIRQTGIKWLSVVACLVLAIAMFVISISTVVQTKNIGVVTAFGATQGDGGLDSGYHTKAPWEKVTDIDGTIQTRTYKGENCLWTRIGDGSRACVSMVLRWHGEADHANQIFADFRSEDPIQQMGDDLVSPQNKAALQKTLGEYNPCGSLKVIPAEDLGTVSLPSFTPDLDAMSATLLEDVEGRSDLYGVDSVDVTYVAISDNTQKCLDDFTKSVGQTVSAQQNVETSNALALANEALEGKVSPDINQARCLDALNAAIEKNYPLPAGFNCLGDGGGTVVVPSAK